MGGLLEDFPKPIRKILSERKTIILKEPILKTLGIDPLLGPVTHELVDSEFNRMIEEKKREWVARGVPERLANMAADLASSWAERITGWHIRHLEGVLPHDELVRIERSLLSRFLREGLDKVAEEWIRAMTA